MKKIGFIFFDSLHIIHHFIGVAVELDKDPNIMVDIITYESKHEYLYSLIKLLKGNNNIVKQVSTYRYRKIIDKLKNRNHPSSKYLLEKHKNDLLNYDALIFNDTNHEYLYNKRKHIKPKFVMLMHGAGDREYLIGDKFKEQISKFDLITTSGDKVNSFYKNMNLENTILKKCGYQKFDLVKIENKNNQFFTNNKPIVLYNPHFQKGLSSWYEYGNKILDFFYNTNNFNLIFAPHINLYTQKNFSTNHPIDEKYFNKKNIHIDLGSFQSVNMAYTMASNIYLGDVSSQVYEFLMNYKPCIFINSHNADWKNNIYYQNWNLGKVISDISNLKHILESANDWQIEFKEKQKKAMEYTFHQPKNKTATQLVAKTLKSIL